MSKPDPFQPAHRAHWWFWMRALLLVAAAALSAVVSAAHEQPVERPGPVVIETDAGLDDMVTLAMALQAPALDLAGIIVVPGVSGTEVGIEHLERLLDELNRREVPLWRPVAGCELPSAPPFRAAAEGIVGAALTEAVEPFARPFAPEAYSVAGHRATTLLALGPLSNLAAALAADPQLAERLARVVIPGPADLAAGWNLRADAAAYEAVQRSGLALLHIVVDDAAAKPAAWREQPSLSGGRATSAAQRFLARLLAPQEVRDHYLDRLGPLLWALEPRLFAPRSHPDTLGVDDRTGLLAAIDRTLRRGRQPKARVVFTDAAFPEESLQPDVSARRDDIIAAHGEDEWFSQLLLSELHDHLGAYSIIGVKMGLRAAELLNAPPHAMAIVSQGPARPPLSCLDDGLLVATGSTPGRGLFRHEPLEGNDMVRASFSYHGRQLVLELRPEYRQRVASEIADILARHGLESPEYWTEVRCFGLEIWQGWHRLDLFSELPEITTP